VEAGGARQVSVPLADWTRLRDLSRTDLEKRGAQVEDGLGYGQLRGLTRLQVPDLFPGYFFFDAGRPVVLYANLRGEEVRPEQLLEQLGEPEAALRSRSGKRFKQYVYPDLGVAFAADSDSVSFLEIFPPMSLDEYKTTLYTEPPAFIR
jgi:hypothetical protein